MSLTHAEYVGPASCKKNSLKVFPKPPVQEMKSSVLIVLSADVFWSVYVAGQLKSHRVALFNDGVPRRAESDPAAFKFSHSTLKNQLSGCPQLQPVD